MNRRTLSGLVLVLNIIVLAAACRPKSISFSSPLIPPSPPTPTSTPTMIPTPMPLSVKVREGIVLDRFRPQDVFTLLFGQPMDPASTVNPLLFFSPLVGQTYWNDTQTSLTFTPDDGFAPGQTYSVTLNAELKSADGRSFDREHTWQIKVLPAPQVVEAPRTDWSLKERRPSFRIAFDRKMNQDSVAAALSVTPTVPLILEWHHDVQTSTVKIIPAKPLDPETEYRFTLDRMATSADGVFLTRDISWYSRLVALVSRLERANRAADAPIQVHFNYALDADSIQTIRFTPPITGVWGWDEAQKTAIFTPTARLRSNTTYTLWFDGPLCDVNGDPLPQPGSRQFTTPPPILGALPKGENVNPASVIRVTFDRLMDRNKTANAFEISPQVTGRIEWHETTLIFYPDSGYLSENTRYDVTINTDALGEDGEPILNKEYSWTFRTGILQDVADFGWGSNAQVLDADGRRAIQFQILQQPSAALTFELYRLSLEQFLDRYASGFRGVAGWEKRPISTTGTTLVKRWQILPSDAPKTYDNIQEVIIPPDVPPGLYILNLVAGRVNDQLILLLTRHTLMVKQAEGQLVAWVTDINDRPVPGIEVGVYARDGTLIAGGTADEKGVYRTQVARDPQPLIVVARQGDDITASGLSNEWRSYVNGWWNWWRMAPAANRYAVYIYTDRPIYRPGQTVFFKAIIRRDDDALLSPIPEGTPVTVRIRDARNNVVQTFDLTGNAFGSVNGSFQLAEGAMLGQYAVEVVPGGTRPETENHRQAFKVEDYRKPDYQVTVNTDAQNYVVGDQMTVTVNSRYFFGEPVANADLTLNLYRAGGGYRWNEHGADYDWYWSDTPYMRTRTDANGFFTLTLKAEMDNGDDYNWWYSSSLKRSTRAIEATVDDGSHQTVSGIAVWHVYNAAEKIGLDSGGYFKEPNRPFTVRAGVSTVDDHPVRDRKLRLELRRYSLDSGDYTETLQSAEATTDADGVAEFSFTVEEPGYYRLYVSGEDRSGRPIRATTWIYVFSDSSYANRCVRMCNLNVYADRDRYAPGETARLLIESDFSGPALLTFERGTTRREQLVELTAPMTVIDVPIRPDDMPNIHVTVNAWKAQDTTLQPDIWRSLADSKLHAATVNLAVPVTDKTLKVTIVPDRENYVPRQEASFTIRVTDAQGRPVQAEVSLAMVDEAIFALSKELAGPIFDAFYHPRNNIVRTYDAMSPFRSLWSGGMGGGGGDGDMAGGPRSDFPDTARWFPALQTDANGEVVVAFRLPDSLTSWRLTAKAVTADTQVGEAQINVVTKQEIIVRPILPRTLTAGDAVQLSALVHNYGSTARQITLAIQTASIVQVQHPITQTVFLAPGEVRVVGWWARALETGEAQVVVRARTADGKAGDAVSMLLPIRPLAIADVTTQIGEFAAALTTTIRIPSGALGISTVHIELSRSIAGSMWQGLEYLTGFPYGCVEQTMSRALPNAVVGRALRKLGVSNPALADLPAQINASIQRLYGYQHNDGGWGWWYDDATDAYQTAWVVFGLSMTAEAGYEIDRTVVERGVQWLESELNRMDPRTRAFALYSMAIAGHGNLEATQSAMRQAGNLDTFSRAALALALYKLGAQAEAEVMVGELVENAVVNGGLVSWTGDQYDGYYHQKTMSSHIRSTALALSALVQIRPGHLLEGGVVRWLMGQRKLDGWGSTNETAFTLLALTDHLLAAREATANTGYRVELNGVVIADGTLGPDEPTVSLDIPVARMAIGDNALRIHQSGSGRLYYVIATRIYLAQEKIDPAGIVQVARTYLDPQTNKPITRVEAGQLVKVQLTFNMSNRGAYIIVEDRLPGGLEALNERLDTSSHAARVYEEPRYYWQEYGYNRKEVRADRVCFFYTELGSGTHTVTYVARATHAGEFVAMPVEVSAMYDATIWGRSASNRLTVSRPHVESPKSP